MKRSNSFAPLPPDKIFFVAVHESACVQWPIASFAAARQHTAFASAIGADADAVVCSLPSRPKSVFPQHLGRCATCRGTYGLGVIRSCTPAVCRASIALTKIKDFRWSGW
jgi:hypothetical protein